MKEGPYLIPFYIPQESCPHACVYCNAFLTSGEALSGRSYFEKRIRSFLLTRRGRGSCVEATFYGGSFGNLPKEKRKKYFSYVRPYIREGLIDSIRLSLRPDSVTSGLIDEIKKEKTRVVELGVQTMNERVLRAIERGHSPADARKAVKALKSSGIKVSLHVMPGLPHESEKDFFKSYGKILKLKPDYLRIHPTLVLKGTKLETLWRNGAFRPLSLDDAVRICARAYLSAKKAKIQVLRMGLQPNEFLDKGAVLCGPYHPAFGELVMSRVYFDMMKREILKKGFLGRKSILVLVNQREISKALGLKRSNLLRLALECKIENLEIRGDSRVKEEKILLKSR